MVIDLQEGNFPFVDSHGEERIGHLRLVPIAVVKAGKEYPVAEHLHAHA